MLAVAAGKDTETPEPTATAHLHKELPLTHRLALFVFAIALLAGLIAVLNGHPTMAIVFVVVAAIAHLIGSHIEREQARQVGALP